MVVSRYTAGFQLHEAIATLAFHTTKWLAFTIPGTAFTDTIPLAGTVWSLPYEWLFYAFPPVALFCLHAVPPVPWLIFSLTAVVALTTLMPEVARRHAKADYDGIILLAGGFTIIGCGNSI